MTQANVLAQIGATSGPTNRNRIINGAMVIDQRNTGSSITPSNGQYNVDRWVTFAAQSSKFTVQQNAGSVTPPAGFTNYVGITSSSAYSSVSTDYFCLMQRIEGYNVSDLGWGTANAKTVTLSFQVYSSLTGTFSGALLNASETRCYPFTYTVSSANTWTTVSVTITGDTTGTWVTNNGIGMEISFNLGSGSTKLGSAGSWQSAGYLGVTGSVSVVGTNGATFYITGVQLEVGSSATGFEYRQYGTELALCQRYFEVGYNLIQAYGNAGNGVFAQAQFKATKRAVPSVTNQGLSYAGQATLPDFTLNAGNPSYADGYSTPQAAVISAYQGGAPSTGMVRYQGYFTASAEL